MRFVRFQELSASPTAPVMESVIMNEIWTSTLKKRLSRVDFVLLQSIRLQGMVLLIFCKSKHVKNVRNVDTAYLRLGVSGWWVRELRTPDFTYFSRCSAVVVFVYKRGSIRGLSCGISRATREPWESVLRFTT